jgi:hypothetical protein
MAQALMPRQMQATKDTLSAERIWDTPRLSDKAMLKHILSSKFSNSALFQEVNYLDMESRVEGLHVKMCSAEMRVGYSFLPDSSPTGVNLDFV